MIDDRKLLAFTISLAGFTFGFVFSEFSTFANDKDALSKNALFHYKEDN